MGVGRPSKYNEDTVAKARHYLEHFKSEYEDEIPSVAGLACALGVARDTIYAWAVEEGKEEFSDTLDDIQSKQEKVLWSKGLNGTFNSNITKLALGNHGHHEKKETEHSGTVGFDIDTVLTAHEAKD